MFRTPDEEARDLAREIREFKDVLREISRKLGQIEARVKRVFPAAFPSSSAGGLRSSAPKLSDPPTMSPQEVLSLYDGLVKMAKEGNKAEVQDQLETINLPDLALLSRELGVSLGKRKPSRKVLVNGVLGRVSESVMLSTSSFRQRTEKVEGTGNVRGKSADSTRTDAPAESSQDSSKDNAG